MMPLPLGQVTAGSGMEFVTSATLPFAPDMLVLPMASGAVVMLVTGVALLPASWM